MKFKEYDIVKIKKNCEDSIKKGEIGAIIMVFQEPREAYEVEILDEEGNPKAECTLLSDDLEFVEN